MCRLFLEFMERKYSKKVKSRKALLREDYKDGLQEYGTDLAPNIKTTGSFVYNVPTDSEGYFLKVGKSGTNEMYRLYGA